MVQTLRSSTVFIVTPLLTEFFLNQIHHLVHGYALLPYDPGRHHLRLTPQPHTEGGPP